MIIRANATHIPLKDESVHCCITSPPYFGLRRYKIPDSIWDRDEIVTYSAGGEEFINKIDSKNCEHEWTEGGGGLLHENRNFRTGTQEEVSGPLVAVREGRKGNDQFCLLCGAWKGQLGGEPSISLYVSHLVQIFREIRRVLRRDGVLWLNLGDSYASGKGSCYNPGGGKTSLGQARKEAGVHPLHRKNVSELKKEGLKPKDLCEIPSEVVRALRDDGWWLRSRIPWLKRNSLPESVSDRPTVSVEYIFLLTKSPGYFYDAESIKIRASDDTHARYARGRSTHHKYADGGSGNQTIAKSFNHMIGMPDNYKGSIPGLKDGPGQDRRSKKDRLPGVHPKSTEPGTGIKANSSFEAAVKDVVGSRNRRNSDWFFESWQGLLSDAEGDPLALIVNPQPYKGAHYSVFPEALIEPMIKAGTSECGCCRKCGSPWKREVEKTFVPQQDVSLERGIKGATGQKPMDASSGWDGVPRGSNVVKTIGWQPTCSCDGGDPVQSVILDPFFGSGTVGVVAERLNRRWVGLDLGYQDLQRERLVGIQKEMPLIG